MAVQPYYQNSIDGNGTERCQFVFEGLRCAPNGELAWQTNAAGAIGSVVFTGQQKFADGSAAAPSLTFASDLDTGLFRPAANQLGIAANGANYALFASGELRMGSGSQIGWSSAVEAKDGNADTIVVRDAANTLAQRNGTNGQVFNIYKTYTSGTSQEKFTIDATGSPIALYTSKGSSGGTARGIGFGTDSITRWQIGATDGHLTATVDNTYDIGAAGATRPKDYYGAGNITIGGTLSAATAIATIGPATPAGTTSLTFVMMGLAGSITTKTGKIVLTMSGVMADSLANDGSKCQMSYGTGTAPVNGAAVTGTQVGPIQQFNAANVNAETCPYGATWIITGLTPNTAYWFDTALAAITGGTATITQATMVAHDLP